MSCLSARGVGSMEDVTGKMWLCNSVGCANNPGYCLGVEMICPVISNGHEIEDCQKTNCAWCVEISTGEDMPSKLVCVKVVRAMAAADFYVGVPGDADGEE